MREFNQQKLKMRVGFDARWYSDSGVGTYVADLLKALIALRGKREAPGHDLELLVYEDPRNPIPGLEGNSFERVAIEAGRYSPAAQFELRSRARRDQLDVFHSPFYPIPLGLKCPVVVTLHDLIPFLFRTDPWLKQSIIKAGYRMAAKRSRRIIAVSQHTAQDIKKILRIPADKIKAIHNGVSHVEFHADALPSERDELARRYGICFPFIAAGSARNWRTKNLASALRALVLAQQLAGVKFQTVVYGPPDGLTAAGGPERWKQINLVNTGLLPAAELARVFRHAEMCLVPSLYEGFGLAALEAMACGCAVITSNTGSLPEVVGEGGQALDPFDVTGMANAVARLLGNPNELRLWKQRALARAGQFSWEKAAKETARVYYQAITR